MNKKTEAACTINELIRDRPIHFDCGEVHVEPDVAEYLAKQRVPVDVLLAQHVRLIPSRVMVSTDHYQNRAAAPRKQMVLSVYPIGDQDIWVETEDGHATTRVRFAPVLHGDASEATWFSRVLRILG